MFSDYLPLSQLPKIGFLKCAYLYDGDGLHPDCSLFYQNGKVLGRVKPKDIPADAAIMSLQGVLTPGFIDLQVNGGGGALLNATPTVETIKTLAAAHRAGGTTGVYPTVITDHPDVTEKAAKAVLATYGSDGVLGLHIEGPHINPTRKGTHKPEYIRPFDEQTMTLLTSLREHNLPVMLTIAPELVPLEIIRSLSDMGVIVAAGHTDASAAQINEAIDAGLSCFTHLYNAMSQMSSRAPGTVGAAIHSDKPCGIILDGHHVDPIMAHIAFDARPPAGEMFLVSDAMATWNGPDAFELYGTMICVQNGRLVNQDGNLAGAHIDMAGCVARGLGMGFELGTLLRAAICTPRKIAGLDPIRPGLKGMRLDELIVLNPKETTS